MIGLLENVQKHASVVVVLERRRGRWRALGTASCRGGTSDTKYDVLLVAMLKQRFGCRTPRHKQNERACADRVPRNPVAEESSRTLPIARLDVKGSRGTPGETPNGKAKLDERPTQENSPGDGS